MDNLAEIKNSFEGSLGIAIIGMAARLPGAPDVHAFWDNLCAGKELIHFFSDEELRAAGVSQAELDDPNYVKAAPILEDIDLFDASFFDYTAIEATYMDPQQRLLLECAWQALEDAGYTGARASDSIGVYAGIKMNTYVADFFANADLFGPEDKMQIMMGNGDFSLATRISYKLNLKGPCYMLQTACSTSLAAVHLACQALLLDECRMALAGAVAVEVPHKAGYYYQYGGPASPDGHCRPFDAKAQGTVFGSGVGMVVLKRLDDALADGDHIYAVIRGAAVNNDGAVKASFTAPSVEGQTKVIMEAVACANVDVNSISYVEGHGTATPLGDPIEIMALTNAFRAGTNRKGFCRIGSVKGNLGHLDATAGMVGLIKTVLALQHKKIPPSLHYEQPNPEIDFDNSPFVVNTELTAWESVPLPRRAGVSSFGFGGTNTHVILEEAPVVEPSKASRPCQLLVISAKTDAALDAATTNLAAHLKQNPQLNLADVTYTLQLGRPGFKYRRAIVCQDMIEAVSLLEEANNPRVVTGIQETSERPVVFMFTGQGAQYVNMGRDLYETEPVFREHVDRCAEMLIPHLGLDLRTILYPDSPEADAAAQKLEQTAITQPALFVVEYALAQLWQSWGISPKAMIGHSIGEYVAACLAGVFSLQDALALVAARGRLMQQLPAGAMLTVPLAEAEVRPFLNQALSLAAINGPSRCVVSGPAEVIAELEQRLNAQGIPGRRLHTSHAFHSAMMEPILEPFTEQVKEITLHAPQIPYISDVSGTWVTAKEATNPAYWAEHLRRPVRFAEGLAELLVDPDRVLLEVGPGRTLGTFARQQLGQDSRQVVLASLHDPKDDQPDIAFLLNTLGRLWLAGVQVNWAGLYTGERRQRLPLPTYPFERRRYWFDPPKREGEPRAELAEPEQRHAAKKADVADWFYIPSWKRSPLPVNDSNETATRSWLVFTDEYGLGARLAERLEQAGHEVVVTRVGSEFARLSERAFALDPVRREDYVALLNELHAMDKRPQGIVHLWSVGKVETEWPVAKRIAEAQTHGFYSLLYLLQALGQQDSADPLHLVVVSSNTQEVTGAEALCPEKATLLGLTRVVPLEYPNIGCRSVDVELPPPRNAIDPDLADLLYAEITAQSSAQAAAYRGRHRWEQLFEPTRLERSEPGAGQQAAHRGGNGKVSEATPSSQTYRLRERGVYLITGGLGSIGLLLAGYLAETVKARLVLTGRSAFPSEGEWDAWLSTHAEKDDVSRKIRQLNELQALGAEVLLVRADVSNLQEMQAAIARAQERFGALNGVFHAAGTGVQKLDKVLGFIQDMDQAKCDEHLTPKVQGSLVLDQALQGQALDFCILFSSLSAVLGGVGFGAYAAANQFMDAFAQQQLGRSAFPWLSIDWDTWQFDADKGSQGATVADFGITPSEGVEIFQRVLSRRVQGQLVVSTGDLNSRRAQASKARGNGRKVKLSFYNPRPNLRSSYLAPSNELERKLAGIWQDVLGIERVGVQDNFFELGGDSLIGLKLIAQLKQEFGLEIPAVDLYKGPTVSRLADIINQMQGQAAPDESARKAGQSRGAQRRERRVPQRR